MKEKTLVTIVVPIYNVEKYLNRCIESILNQSYENIEILLINDGSQDKSIAIAEEKEKQDKRIKIISQDNQGLSAARNTGIRHARGEYICFVDSDDFIHKDYVKSLLENVIKNNADICACDFYYINENNEIWNKKKKQCGTYTNIEAIKDILTGKQETEIMTWNKLYKTSLFTDYNINFPKGKLHEDNFTTYKLYYYSKNISLITDKLYYYLQRSNSIMGQKFNIKRLDVLEAIKETRSFLEQKNIDLMPEFENYEIITKIGILNNMLRDNFDGREREKLIEEIKSKKKVYLKNKNINPIIKCSLLLLFKKGRLYKFVYTIFNKLKYKKGEEI